MSHRHTESRAAIAAAVEKFGGATVTFYQSSRSHDCADLTAPNGRTGKVFFAATPSDRNSFKNAAHGVEKKLRELSGVVIAPKVAQPSVRREKRRPQVQPQAREQSPETFDRLSSGNYRSRHPGEYNAMSSALRALKDGRP
jgi:hypothetical protein